MNPNVFQGIGTINDFLLSETFILGEEGADKPTVLQVITAEMLDTNEQRIVCVAYDFRSSRWEEKTVCLHLIKARQHSFVVTPTKWKIYPMTSEQQEAVLQFSEKPVLLLKHYIKHMAELLSEHKFDEAVRKIVVLHDESVRGKEWYQDLIDELNSAYLSNEDNQELLVYWKTMPESREADIIQKFIVTSIRAAAFSSGQRDEGNPYER